jgi:hypothetical protein
MMKTAFVRVIKNCIFKSKLERFLERVKCKMLERAFDKVKENMWQVEEKRSLIEAILLRSQLK